MLRYETVLASHALYLVCAVRNYLLFVDVASVSGRLFCATGLEVGRRE